MWDVFKLILVRECGDLELQHGQVTLESYTVGSLAAFSCDDGYQLRGPSPVLLCQVNGEWAPEAPTCTGEVKALKFSKRWDR